MLTSHDEWTATQTAKLKGKRVLVMGSGNGSNFEALVHALRPYGVEMAGLFCDRPGAKILERAQRLGVPTFEPPPIPQETEIHPKRHLNDAVLEFLSQPFDLVALAGYMRVLPPRIVRPHQGKIVNIHPSLLPAYPGLNSIERAHEAGEKIMGITVHLVVDEVDAGPVLGQSSLKVEAGESLDSVTTRIHALEHALYPRCILSYLIQQSEASA